MTLDQLNQNMSSTELDLWKAFSDLEPFGADRDNYHLATLTAFLGNVFRTKGDIKFYRPYRFQDFMFEAPEVRKEREDIEFLHFLNSRAKNGN